MSTSLIDHFSSLEDPRIERNKRHALLDILVLVVSAVSSYLKVIVYLLPNSTSIANTCSFMSL